MTLLALARRNKVTTFLSLLSALIFFHLILSTAIIQQGHVTLRLPSVAQLLHPFATNTNPGNIDRTIAKLPAGLISTDSTKPEWLSTPRSTPLVIRLAIITRTDGFGRRAAFREAVLRNISSTDVELEYVFVMGYHAYTPPTTTMSGNSRIIQAASVLSAIDTEVAKERALHNDILLLPMQDTQERMTEKRYRAMQWAQTKQKSSKAPLYDWFMTIDDDTFVRFSALARRLAADRSFITQQATEEHGISNTPNRYINIGGHSGNMSTPSNPRVDPVLIGRMGAAEMYWNNIISDVPSTVSTSPVINHGGFIPDTTAPEDILRQDDRMKGPWYHYPSGIGYLMSSALVSTLVSAPRPLPHHVAYPADDMVIGSWIASLWAFHPSAPPPSPNENTFLDFEAHPWVPIAPEPHTAHPIVTRVIDDVEGFHDAYGRGGHDAKMGWDSVAVHRVKTGEMRALKLDAWE